MPRILLIIDDYNEMMYLQTLLKKLGFDVDSLTNTRNFSDAVLSFNPKFIVMTAQGKKVNGIELAKALVKRSGLPRVFLLKFIGQSFSNGELSDTKIDRVMETPVNILNLLKSVCEIETQLKFENLSAKLSNIIASDKQGEDLVHTVKGSSSNKSDVYHVRGGDGEAQVRVKSNMSWEERSQKYEKFLKSLKDAPTGLGGFPKQRIKDYNKRHRIEVLDERMSKLDQHKKDFVKALYSHIKKSS